MSGFQRLEGSIRIFLIFYKIQSFRVLEDLFGNFSKLQSHKVLEGFLETLVDYRVLGPTGFIWKLLYITGTQCFTGFVYSFRIFSKLHGFRILRGLFPKHCRLEGFRVLQVYL